MRKLMALVPFVYCCTVFCCCFFFSSFTGPSIIKCILKASNATDPNTSDFILHSTFFSAVALASKSSQGILEREQFNLAQMFLVGGLSFILGGSASLALYAYIHSFRMAMRDAKRREKLQKQEKVRQQQRTLERKLSRHSMKHQPSFSSQVSLDNFFTLRNKMYDVGAIMKDTDYNKEGRYSTLDRQCALKTFTIKDL